MKLKCDEALSNFAFNFNLRHYIEVMGDDIAYLGRAVQVDSINTRVESAAWFQRLIL